jgi:thioredoxin reductase (NADPH)
MRDLIIIGGGAAGLAAAIYAQEKQLDYLLVAPTPGKAAIATWGDTVGAALMQLFADRLTVAPDCLLADRVHEVNRAKLGFVVQTEQNGPQEALTVLVATGVQPVPLPAIDGAPAPRHELSYSPATHAQRMAGKHVAVIGATPRSLRGAHELASVARRVSLVAEHVGDLTTPLGVSVQYHPNVDLLDGYHLVALERANEGVVLQVERGAITRHLTVDAVFADLGLHPDSALVRPLLQTDEQGFIPVDQTGATAQAGLFAAGDVTTALAEQVLVAVGQGARAAQSAYEYVLARQSLRH